MININQKSMEETLKNIIKATQSEEMPGIFKYLNPKYISCSFENKEVVVEFPVKEWQLSQTGFLQSGFLNTFFDSAIGYLVGCFMDMNSFIVTLDIACDFIQPIPKDEILIFKCRLISFGNTIIKTEAEAYLKNSNTPAAYCTSKFMIVKSKKNDVNYNNYL